ncbi:hypothetical protein [Caulobacter soli]|uniref:hypothetical protein n=1 Tax=Caulobacter soli TaxID=2708539 RepID=UPI0013ED1CCC|nr:hypothetical protein [Caulobacter soli]
MTNKHERCPLAAVDQRLEDLHRQWHQAEAAYFDPDAFRVAIQTAIQTLRTVTFILQSNKAIIPNFDCWYEDWQEKFRVDPLMTWMKDARNKIEKQGDLEAKSFVRAEIIASYLNEGPKVEVPAKLWDAPIQLVKSIPADAMGAHVRKNGVVRIQRRWIENTLPEHELLDAVATAYGRLSELVADAHAQVGLPTGPIVNKETGEEYPPDLRAGRLPCMIGHADARTQDVWLATDIPIEFEVVEKKVKVSDLKEAGPRLEKRYDVRANEMYAESGKTADHLRTLFATARKMFEKDGYHITIAFLLRDGKPVHFRELRPGEHGHKYLMMRSLAHQVVSLGADAAIIMGETWSAPADPNKPYQRAADSPDRSELLVATLVTRTGEPVQLSAKIQREGKLVKLDPTEEEVGGAHFLFAPIYEAWGRDIPDDWMKMGEMAAGDKV